MGCCGSGGGFRANTWQGNTPAPKGTTVWRHQLPDGETFPDGDTYKDYVTWVEADASRARLRSGEYFQTIAD